MTSQRTLLGSFGSRATAAAIVGLTFVTLTGCGNDDGDGGTPTTTTTTATATATATATSDAATSPAGTPSSSTPAASTTTTGSAAPTSNVDIVERAGRTALGSVPGTTLVSIEEEGDGTWEIDVVDSEGVDYDLGVSPDGGEVVAGPQAGVDDADDRAERRERIAAAQLDFVAATDAVSAEVPGARITELSLETEKGGTYVWEAEVIDGSGAGREVFVDAVNGRVLQNTPTR